MLFTRTEADGVSDWDACLCSSAYFSTAWTYFFQDSASMTKISVNVADRTLNLKATIGQHTSIEHPYREETKMISSHPECPFTIIQ